MVNVKTITFENFKKKFHVKELDPFSTDIFNEDDIKQIQQDFGIIGLETKIGTIGDLVKVFLKEPVRILTHLPKIIKVHTSGLLQYYSSKTKPTKSSYPFSDYMQKASIIGMVNPKKLLEIGTARGWGIAAFKAVLPKCDCYTMEPKTTTGANNELPTEQRGKAFSQKKLDVKQIWADSLTFDYKSFGPVDVSYIDGNHKYDYVYSDLVNCDKITTKMLMVDDYIPTENSPRGGVLNWGWWNADVVKAVHDFLNNYPKSIKEAYWIENSPIGVLLK